MDTEFDVVIVGAGIQGAGIAQACAENSWRVLVVERNSYAGMETSSNSSKLIHGGLRYLETFQFGLVYECLAERRFLLKNMSSLVKLKPFYIPVYKGIGRKPWWVFLGLSLYCLLGGGKKENRFKIISKSKWAGLGIKTQDLLAVFQYFDAQTDDQQLTQVVMSNVKNLGAEVCYDTAILAAQSLEEGGYNVHLSDGSSVKCKALVNASGPWVNRVAEFVVGAPTEQLQWVQGSHIVLDVPGSWDLSNPDFEGGVCFYFESPVDGRAFFVLPWQGKVMVGTTEVILDFPSAKITDAEIEYLLENFNAYFPDKACTKQNICKTYSGVRVLPLDSSSKNPNQRSRETVFLQRKTTNSLYLAIYGGKLTSFRATAKKVVRLLKAYLQS